MKTALCVLTLCLVLLSGGCRKIQDARGGPHLIPTVDYTTIKDGPIELAINEMASLPGGVVILGGQYKQVDPLHTALLVSRDEGRTWKDAGFKYDACGIQNIRTNGRTNIWAIVTFKTEGCHDPLLILRSTDAGATWDLLPLDLIADETDPLVGVSQFRFDDDKHGLLTIEGSVGLIKTYMTSDGGSSWQRLWETRRDIISMECSYKYPDADDGRLPPNAALWVESLDYCKINRVVRARETEKSFCIEIYEFGKKGWTEQAQIPKFYKVQGAELVAIENP
ncbi:MAG: hypothetical protein ABIF71_04260 [Planctomycetota bacterium]